MGGRVRAEHQYSASNAGGSLFEDLQPLPHHLEIDEREARDVPARMRQARHEPLLNGIADPHYDDGNGTGRLPQRAGDWRRVIPNNSLAESNKSDSPVPSYSGGAYF